MKRTFLAFGRLSVAAAVAALGMVGAAMRVSPPPPAATDVLEHLARCLVCASSNGSGFGVDCPDLAEISRRRSFLVGRSLRPPGGQNMIVNPAYPGQGEVSPEPSAAVPETGHAPAVDHDPVPES